MFDAILQNEELSGLRRELCDDNGIGVEVSNHL